MGKPISVRFSQQEEDLLEEAVSTSPFSNKSNYIREAVMEKIEGVGGGNGEVGTKLDRDDYLNGSVEMIQELIKMGRFKTKGDFIRAAIIEKLVKTSVRDEAALISKALVNHDEQFDRSTDHVMKRIGEIAKVMCEQYDMTNDSLRSLSHRMEVLENPLNDAEIYADLMDRLVTKVSSLSSQMELMVEQNIALITLLTDNKNAESRGVSNF